MSTAIKVERTEPKRSDKEAARAAPVALPAGSFDATELAKRLDDSALAKNDDKRDDMRREIVDDANETDLPAASLGVPPGYKRVTVDDKRLGIEEERVVFDTDQREEAEAAQDANIETIDPAAGKAADKKGE